MTARRVAIGVVMVAALGGPTRLASAPPIDLTHTSIVVSSEVADNASRVAADVLQQEIARRTGLTWPIVNEWPRTGAAVVVDARAGRTGERVSRPVAGSEGYRLVTAERGGQPVVTIAATDVRTALFGVGGLLRTADWRRGRVTISGPVEVTTAPRQWLRGHQLGYRHHSNTYDGWDEAHYDQYIRELVLLGANAIENIPFQDTRVSPLMPLSRAEMNRRVSAICAKYGIQYWLWMPADFDLRDARARDDALAAFERLSNDTPRLDAIFVPGGDPGDNPASLVVPWLGDLAARLATRHPDARVWVSLQHFDRSEVDFLFDWIDRTGPPWLGGLVAGPGSYPLDEIRRRLSPKYRLRDYPDIGHTVRSQYPVPWWDPAFNFTLGREPVNPRPEFYAGLHDRLWRETDGFITYSDGVNDDFNKALWTLKGWDPALTPHAVVRAYARMFFGADLADRASAGLMALERNWRGPLESNTAVAATLALWDSPPEEVASNWRWQMHQMRAAYDAYTRERLLYESRLESDAIAALAAAPRDGATAAMAAAARMLDRATAEPCCPTLRARIDELCEALFRHIRMQTSIARHGASGAERGAVLDFIDHPLNNRWWLEDQFGEIRQLSGDAVRLARLRTLVTWTRPGEGSFYDDVGNVAASPRVMRGEHADAGGAALPHFTWEGGPTRSRLSTLTSLRWPAGIEYTGLDSTARYVARLLVVRPGKTPQVRLRIDGEPASPRPAVAPNGALEFDVPAGSVADGRLTLTFDEIDERDVNWRQYSRLTDVWLIRQDGPRVEQVFGPEVATGPYKHPACLTELDNGDLFLVYFGGEGEYASDTAVFGARRPKGSGSWTTPVAIARDPQRPLGNAVVWQAPDGVAWLFYVVRHGATWSTSRIEARTSRDGAVTWSDPIKLHDAEGMMVRNRPIVLSDGDYLLPVYVERGDDTESVGAASTSLFLRYQKSTGTWRQTGAITSPRGVIQPAVVEISPGHLVAYNRRGGGYGPTTDGWMIRAESRDGGWTWTPGRDTPFPNPNAAVEFVKLTSGNLLLVYNDSMVGRTPLIAALSTDGDRTYPYRRAIAEGKGDFAYPIALQAKDGTIHVVYTSDGRRVVNHAVFSEAWLLGR